MENIEKYNLFPDEKDEILVFIWACLPCGHHLEMPLYHTIINRGYQSRVVLDNGAVVAYLEYRFNFNK